MIYVSLFNNINEIHNMFGYPTQRCSVVFPLWRHVSDMLGRMDNVKKVVFAVDNVIAAI